MLFKMPLYRICFYSFLAFCSFSTAAEKTKNKAPKENPAKESKIPYTKKQLIDKLWEKLNPDYQPLKPVKQQKTHKKTLTKTQTNIKKTACTVELKIEGFIGAATLDNINRAIRKVRNEKCSSLLLLINTPGGQLLSTRKIVDRILNAEFPFLCLIYPAGAQAGSAGAIIMQACHVNGGIYATNIGAATPILGGGKDAPKDLRKKLINDTVSWLNSLTNLRKRSKKFGQEIITQAKSLNAETAVKEKALDFVGETKLSFLQFAQGKTSTVRGGAKTTVQVGDLMPMTLGFRHKLVSLLTEPEIMYILFTGSLLLLYFEITHPGLGAPGILGAMGLIISFVGMHKLDFSIGGLILIILSILLFIAEFFMAGFGIFGAAGAASFLIGSFMLFDPAKTGGVDIPVSLIISVTLVFTLIAAGISYLAFSSIRMKKNKNINKDFLDPDELFEAVKVHADKKSGLLLASGEYWRFQSEKEVKPGDKLKVLCYKKLVLKVEPK